MFSHFPELPEAFKSACLGAAGLFPMAFLGRLLYRCQLVRSGRRRFFTWDLLVEIPTTFFSAVIACAVAEYWELSFTVAMGLAAFAGWLGPRGLEVFLGQFATKVSGVKASNQTGGK